MKTLNLVLLLMILISGCKKEVEFRAYPCENKINSGEFPLSDLAKAIPYDSINGISFINNEGHDCLGMTINLPFFLENPLQWNQKSTDCENSKNPIEYLYLVEEKFTHFCIKSEIELDGPSQVFSGEPSLLTRITSNFKEENDVFEKKGEILEIYGTGADHGVWTNNIDQYDPILSVSLLDDFEQASDMNFGYEFHASIDLNGKTYSNVIVNTNPLIPEAQGGLTHFYFSLKDGLVALRDFHDNLWTLSK